MFQTHFTGKTKLVQTYGKRRQKLVDVATELSPVRPQSPPSPKCAPSPCPAKRAPLQNKLPLNRGSENITATPLKSLKVNAKCDDLNRTPSRPLRELRNGSIKVHPATRVRKPLIPASPRSKELGDVPVRRTRKAGRAAVVPLRGERQVVVEVEIAQQLGALSLNDSSTAAQVDYSELLGCCRASSIIPFPRALSANVFQEVLGHSGESFIYHKIGEASYSEVFSVATEGKELVFKVIPLLSPGPSTSSKPKVELPDCSEAVDVVKEIRITEALSAVPGGGFIDFRGALIAEGEYPQALLKEWDTYKAANGSESVRPDSFTKSQRYAIIVLSNGGVDLETYKFDLSRGWAQAAAVFWQVAAALARAEAWNEFEHRDLHEGQILLSPVESTSSATITNYLDPSATGIRATVIDFGLSRLQLGADVVSTPPPPEVYEGVGDQWDVYRAMRKLIDGDGGNGDWSSFHPMTNVLWLRYIASRLLHRTSTLRRPIAGRSKSRNAAKARAEAAWSMLVDIEKALGITRPTRGQPVPMTSAQAVVEWGRQQGWIE